MYYTLFSLLYYLGLRRGEALGLQWKHVDLNNGTVHIKQTLSNIHSIKNPVLTPPKSKNSVRLIHMPKILLEIMKEWYKHESNKYYFNENAFVFGNIYPLARNTVYNQFKRHMRIGSKGYGYASQNDLIGKLEIDEIVQLKGKVYYNESKKGGYQEFDIHVQIIDIINNVYGLNYVVAMAHHFGHTVDTMLKTYAHLFTDTEQALIQEFNEIIDNEMTSN